MNDSWSPQSPVHAIERSPFDLELQPCDSKALLENEPEPVKTILEGVDVQRGHGVVRADDGRQAELATVAVDTWHIKEHGEEEVPRESLGQLHEGDAYIIRWTYSITTLGESAFVKLSCLAVRPLQWRDYTWGFCGVLTSLMRSTVVLFVCDSGEAAETWRAERRRSREREDGLFFLARPSLQHQWERNLGSDDSGAGQPQGVTSEYRSNAVFTRDLSD